MNRTECLPAAWRLLDFDEGNRLKPYRCTSGFLTIGRGRNLEARGIDPEESDILFLRDLFKAVSFLEIRVPTWPELSPLRQAVLVDMVHALGEAGFLSFRKLRGALERLRFDLAAFEICNSAWVLQLQRLRKRGEFKLTRPERLAEMFRTDQWHPAIPTSTVPPMFSTFALIAANIASVSESQKKEPRP